MSHFSAVEDLSLMSARDLLKQILWISRLRSFESILQGAASRFLANFLAEHRRIVPTETQFWVGRISTKGADHLQAVVIIVEKDVPLLTFDQSNDVDFSAHDQVSPAVELNACFSSWLT